MDFRIFGISENFVHINFKICGTNGLHFLKNFRIFDNYKSLVFHKKFRISDEIKEILKFSELFFFFYFL